MSLDQGPHLLDIYRSLLSHGDQVLVLGYPLTCPWSFGTWQNEASLLGGPADGKACTKQRRRVWGGDRDVSQWAQARALITDVNAKVRQLVDQAGAESGRRGEIRFVRPDQGAWSEHQAWSKDPWIFKNDTWIHPNGRGYQELASAVLDAACTDFHHWCGTPPAWK